MAITTELCPDPVLIVYLDYVVPILAGIAGASVFPALFAFIRAYRNGKIRVYKALFWTGVAFFVLCIAIFATFIPMVATACHDMMASMTYMMTCMQLYTLSTLLLLSQLHYRLYAILKDTEVEISRIINYLMVIYYVLGGIATIISLILFQTNLGMASMRVLVTVMICDVSIAAVLDFVFVYKIWKTLQYTKGKMSSNQSTDRFKMLVTKAGLLAFCATGTTIGCFAVDQLRQSYPWVHWALIFHVIFIADVYTNFVCIFLSYVYFNKYYTRVCSVCHACCQGLWFGDSDKQDTKAKMQHMHMMSSSDVRVETTPSAKLHVGSYPSNGSRSAGDEKERVRRWLTKTVKLPEYIDLFMDEGYDDMVTVQELTDKELQEMGISKRGHRKKILIFAEQYKQRHAGSKSHETSAMGSYSPSPDPGDTELTVTTQAAPGPLLSQVTQTSLTIR